MGGECASPTRTFLGLVSLVVDVLCAHARRRLPRLERELLFADELLVRLRPPRLCDRGLRRSRLVVRALPLRRLEGDVVVVEDGDGAAAARVFRGRRGGLTRRSRRRVVVRVDATRALRRRCATDCTPTARGGDGRPARRARDGLR